MYNQRDSSMDKNKLSGNVYSELWKEYTGVLFDRYTYDLWYKFNRYDLWLDQDIKDRVCLDAGFGSGRAMAAMLGAGAKKVYGLDISPRNVQTAAENLKSFGSIVEVQQGSLLEMPYENEIFDVVHCYGVLHHTTGPYIGFKECCRVLKKGGILFFAMYCKGGLVNHVLDFFRFFTTRGIPSLSVMKKLSQYMFGQDKNHYWYALLDGLYTPIRETYTEEELRLWCKNNSIENVERFYCTWSYYTWPKFLSGQDKGLIILKGIKR